MSKLYTEFLDDNRLNIWKRLFAYKDIGILAGGTALAMQINHRISYDFDIFCKKRVPKTLLENFVMDFSTYSVKPMVDNFDELTIEVSDIKVTFLYYPFSKIHSEIVVPTGFGLNVHHINDISADKAYAIGRRGAWRDYFDIYSILKHGGMSLDNIVSLAEKKYKNVFSSKIFLSQLVYFDDINDLSIDFGSNQIVVANETVKAYLKTEVDLYLSSL